MTQCIEIETEMERKPAQEAAEPKNTQRKSHRGKSRQSKSVSGVALLASAVGLVSIGGLAWLYFYAVSAVQSALSAFQP